MSSTTMLTSAPSAASTTTSSSTASRKASRRALWWVASASMGRAGSSRHNKDRARGRESGEDAQRCLSQDADTHADHCSDNHRPCEAGDR